MEYQGLQIDHLNHDTFRIKTSNKVIYLDPYELDENQIEPADYIFITHQHRDHCSVDDINKIITSKTIIVAGGLCEEKLDGINVKKIKIVTPNQNLEFNEFQITTVPAYNLDKWRSAPLSGVRGVPYHPKEENHVGYVLEIDNVRIYHAGDTDNIPEMSKLGNIDIALLPVSGTYVMTWQEAVEAVKVIMPKLAIPMHYGSIVGTKEDAQKFKENVECRVEII